MVFVTLHVGLGTFRPVSVADVENHVMHKEFYSSRSRQQTKLMRQKKPGEESLPWERQQSGPLKLQVRMDWLRPAATGLKFLSIPDMSSV